MKVTTTAAGRRGWLIDDLDVHVGEDQATATSDDDPVDVGDSPEETVDAFVAAAAEGDCDGLRVLLADEFGEHAWHQLDLVDTCRGSSSENAGLFTELERTGDAQADGEETTVTTEHPDEGEVTFVMVQEAGDWKIENVRFARDATISD